MHTPLPSQKTITGSRSKQTPNSIKVQRMNYGLDLGNRGTSD